MGGVLHFVDDDAGYLEWASDHRSGFVINTGRTPTAAYLKLHRASCRTIRGAPARGSTFTGDYSKVCGDKEDLEAFARSLGGEASPCGLCLPLRAPAAAPRGLTEALVASPGWRTVPAPAGRQVPDSGQSRLAGGHAFISYVHEDAAEVDRLQRRLEAAGIGVWRDTDNLWPGEDWPAKIRQAIVEDALVFIACFSNVSVARERSYQREELLLAVGQLRLRKPDEPWLIPVRFDGCEIPPLDIGAGRTLAAIHWTDLFGPRSGQNAARLIEAVERILSKRSGPVNSRTEARSRVRGYRLPAAIASIAEGLHADNLDERIVSIQQLCRELTGDAEHHWQVVTVLEEFIQSAARKVDDPVAAAADGRDRSYIAGDVAEALKALAYRARIWEPRGLNLKDADLRGARIPRAWFPRANISNSWLDAADLMGIHLEGADLRGTRFPHANLRRAHLADSDLRGAILHDTVLIRSDMRNSRLAWSDLSFARLHSANLIGARLDDADLSRADIVGAVGLNLQSFH